MLQIFAYGQTGAGKTYTMGTAASAKQMASLQEESIIPKALRLIFDSLSTIKDEYAVTLKVLLGLFLSTFHVQLCCCTGLDFPQGYSHCALSKC